MEAYTSKKDNTKNFSFKFSSKKLVLKRYGTDNVYSRKGSNKSKFLKKRFRANKKLDELSVRYLHKNDGQSLSTSGNIQSFRTQKVTKIRNTRFKKQKIPQNNSNKTTYSASPKQIHERSKNRLKKIVVDEQFKRSVKNKVKANVDYSTGDDLGQENLAQMHNYNVEGFYKVNKLRNRYYQTKQSRVYNIQQVNQSSQKLKFKPSNKANHNKKALKVKQQQKKINKKFNIRKRAEVVKSSVVKTVKVVTAKVVAGVKAVFSLKPILIIFAIGLIVAILMVLVMVIIGLFSQMSQSAYYFTASDATKIDKAFTEKEVDYLIMLSDRADQADSDTIINFEDVGHEPHELLAFINVLLYPKYEDTEKLQWTDIEEAIDVAFEARYHFQERVETRTDTNGQERNITYLTSNTESFDNLISGFSGSVPADTREFIDDIGNDAARIAEENGIYASVMMAQAILESASGSSDLARPPHYNLFGIKGSYEGETVFMETNEDDGTGNHFTITDGFRDYPSYIESMEDYAALMKEGPSHGFYAPTWKENTTSYRDATAYLQGTYATDTSYAKKLNDIIEDYNLTAYDNGYSSTSESTSEAETIEITTRSSADNQLEFTDYEKELYQQQKEYKGLMGTYPSPLEGVDWGKQIKKGYGWSWNKEENTKVEEDALHLKTSSGQNIVAQHPSKVSEVSRNGGRMSVVLSSEDTITFTYSNLQNVVVSEGDVVEAGQLIGQTSNEGLILEAVNKDGEVINPQLIMSTGSPTAIMQNVQVNSAVEGVGAGNVTGDADFQNPYAGNDPSTYVVMSEFGMRVHPITNEVKAHNGIDLTPLGGISLPISSAGDGTVIFSNTDSSGSNTVTIQHDSGHITRYMHMAQPSPLKVGQKVNKGDFVGYTGTTGLSTGVHLHFEIHEGQGNPVNPRKYIEW